MKITKRLKKEVVKNGNDKRRNSEKVPESGDNQRKERTDSYIG
jgi:hypothetical protein